MAATSMPVRDAGGNLHDVAQEDNDGIRTPRSVPEVGGVAVSASNPLPIQPRPTNVGGMSTVDLATTSVQVLAARAGRRRLSFQHLGGGQVTLLYGSGTAAVGLGIVLESGGGIPSQGGSWDEPSHDCWAGAVQAIATSAARIMIVEG